MIRYRKSRLYGLRRNHTHIVVSILLVCAATTEDAGGVRSPRAPN